MARKQEANLKPGTKIELTSQRTRRRVSCTIGRLVGEGGSAKVYEGTQDDDGTQIVVKCQRFAGDLDPAMELEISLFKRLNHRNLVHCVGVGATRQGQICIGFRRCYANPLLLLANESVAEEMRRDSKAAFPHLTLDTAIDLGYELLRALRYLERQGIVHHDVKLANLMVDVGAKEQRLDGPDVFSVVTRRNYRGVLIDFGAARTREELERYNDGDPHAPIPQVTPLYAPPEAVVERRRANGELGRTMDPSLDVYAAALVIYAMVTGHPPYSHLKTPPDMNDLESILGVKSAEGRGEIDTISAEVIRRVVFDSTKFVDDRAAFDLAFHRFLAPRLSPDPTERGTITDMLREFEKVMAIDDRRGEGQIESKSQVYLPFDQQLVEVGGRSEHPLLIAARLYGVGQREEALKEQMLKEKAEQAATRAAPRGPVRDQASGLVFVDDAERASDSGRFPRVSDTERNDAPTRAMSRSELDLSVEGARDRAEERVSPDSLHGSGSDQGGIEQVPAIAFRGSAMGLMTRYLTRLVLFVLCIPTLLLAINATGLLASGPGARAVEVASTLAGDPSTWEFGGWRSVEPLWTQHSGRLLSLPSAPLWIGLGLLTLVIFRLTNSIGHYRLKRTEIFGQKIEHTPGFGLGAAIGDPLAILLTGGLATPWIVLANVRRTYRTSHTSAGPMDFMGTGRQVLGLLLLSALLLPLAVGTLGLMGIPLVYAWARWKQHNLLVPDVSGRLRATTFTGSLGRYFLHSLVGWLLTILTLGLLRPWAVVRSWRWLDAHTSA